MKAKRELKNQIQETLYRAKLSKRHNKNCILYIIGYIYTIYVYIYTLYDIRIKQYIKADVRMLEIVVFVQV